MPPRHRKVLHESQVLLLNMRVRVNDVLASLDQLSQELDLEALVPALERETVKRMSLCWPIVGPRAGWLWQ